MTQISFEKIDKARKVLGLEEKASLAEIKSAHRALTKKWHPDKCKKRDKELCHEKMKEINKAHKTILAYIDSYCYSFKEEKVVEDNPEERWKKQFGGDPLWGKGWG